MYKRVLVPLYASALAEQALPHAIAQAKHLDAELLPLQVLAPLPRSPLLGEPARGRAQASLNNSAREYLERVVAPIRELGVLAQMAFAEGNLPVTIIEFAEARQVDLIVMSPHGQSGLSRWLVGSVADRVVRSISVPVRLVRARKDEPVRIEGNA
jgi:nucleotide-binding universal stress UspA family protein